MAYALPPRELGPPPGVAPHRLSAAEREQLHRDGYVVRQAAISRDELARLGEACERMVAQLQSRSLRSPKLDAGSYCFQADVELCTILKWEPGAKDVVQGVEPFAHFDPVLSAWGLDPRFADPMRDLLGTDEIELFTEKLNVKRAQVGGPIVLHQDYPYWVANSIDPGEIGTACLFLDDADRGNGCLEVVPGSHLGGVREGGGQEGFGEFEMDPQAVPEDALVALEVPAGTVVYFGSLLVHRSLPNASPNDRRTLLYSYQPAGREPSVASLARLLRRPRSAHS